ncbi:hypothetical protein [Burkholderia pseudomallei]|uniref:hypothetical protein n=1 Tax=Burkholderia pseudomallei TaxID=28450 RepID=UPI0009760CE3|nr:hypothetical protein [Burkholderia pseudomallei]AYX37339.1 hypothetical protein EGY15_03720 [Burkholderia pseudomallei]MBD2919967.1 hypothetical protein [Burkholderia pseudomallei]MBD2999403.1 hypothetical protein [Burkholderia pseudomallei]QBI44547.1 hypothetical protein EXY28_34370 [Burkholderia pseudomallei]QBI51221.1 hypothetical protein EXY72_34390 [Burkholderia pseudomallei]
MSSRSRVALSSNGSRAAAGGGVRRGDGAVTARSDVDSCSSRFGHVWLVMDVVAMSRRTKPRCEAAFGVSSTNRPRWPLAGKRVGPGLGCGRFEIGGVASKVSEPGRTGKRVGLRFDDI